MAGTAWEKRQKMAEKAAKLVEKLMGVNNHIFIPGFKVETVCRCRFYNEEYWCEGCKEDNKVLFHTDDE